MKHIFLSLVVFLLSGTAAFAASSIYIETEPAVPAAGNEFVARVYTQSDQPLNGYELVVSYDTTAAELVRADTSGSLIDVWPKQPTVYAGGVVRWSGASATPFVGERGELMALRFRANVDASTVAINMDRGTAVYLANGKGTKVPVAPREFLVQLGPAGSGSGAGPGLEVDIAPPEIPFIALERDPITPGQKFLSFQANDRESGIEKLEARTRSWLWWSSWRSTRNPDALVASVWSAEVRVTDHAGNVALAAVYDWPAAGTKGGMLALGIAALAWFVRALYALLRRREN